MTSVAWEHAARVAWAPYNTTRAAEPVAYADDIEYITAPDGAARAI